MATAKALAEGKGYTLINLPGAPPQTKYPPLYPAVLAAVWTIWPEFPSNLVALKAVSLISAALALSLAYLYLVRFRCADESSCLLGAAICATGPSFIYFATQTLSESLFSLLLVLGMWMVDWKPVSGGDLHVVFSRGVLSTLPFFCRSIGIAFLPVGLTRFARPPRHAFAYLAGAGLVAGAWFVWVAVNLGEPRDPTSAYYTVQPYLDWWFDGSALRVPVLNLLWLATSIGVLPAEGLVRLGFSEFPFFTVLGGAVCLVTFSALRRGRSSLLVLFAVYFAVILFWPWPPHRFLVSLAPLLTIFFVTTLKRISRFLLRRENVAVVGVLVGIVIAINLAYQVRLARLLRSSGYPYAVIPSRAVSWSSYSQMFDWIRVNTRRGSIVASGLDSMVYLYTDRPAIRPFVPRPASLFYMAGAAPIGTGAEFRSQLRSSGAAYLLQLPMPHFSEDPHLLRLIEDTLHKMPACLTEEHRLAADERFVLYSVRTDRCLD